MNMIDPLREMMRAIRAANPDVVDIELEGVADNIPPFPEAVPLDRLFTNLKWRVHITFNDGDHLEMGFYDSEMDALKATQIRLGEWFAK